MSMSDETVIIRKAAPTYAYLFWMDGVRRGEHVALKAEGTTVGRSSEADIVLDDLTVSEEHARFRFEGDTWYVYDLASANSVLVGGEPIRRHALADKDRLQIGMANLVFRLVR
jgi:pSer/pThr/pTyr-binding forkhead associated (FHA) protein